MNRKKMQIVKNALLMFVNIIMLVKKLKINKILQENGKSNGSICFSWVNAFF